MGIKQDVEDSLKDYPITTIEGQPDEEALSKLRLELVEGLASIPTLNGGGQHGQIGMTTVNCTRSSTTPDLTLKMLTPLTL